MTREELIEKVRNAILLAYTTGPSAGGPTFAAERAIALVGKACVAKARELESEFESSPCELPHEANGCDAVARAILALTQKET